MCEAVFTSMSFKTKRKMIRLLCLQIVYIHSYSFNNSKMGDSHDLDLIIDSFSVTSHYKCIAVLYIILFFTYLQSSHNV